MQQEITQNSCQMMGLLGVIVQLFLGILSFSVLIFKRQHQYPKRPWKIWALDTSKQGVSQLIAHFINIGISLLLSVHLESDACFWYFTTNVLDNTIGVFICVGVLKLVQEKFSTKYEHLKSGNYFKVKQVFIQDFAHTTNRSSQITNSFELQSLQLCGTKKSIKINYLTWFSQFLIWNLIVIICKTLLLFVELFLNKPLNTITEFLLGWVQSYPALQLVIVIIIVPVFMNGLAFWIQDNFLKKKFSAEQLLTKQALL